MNSTNPTRPGLRKSRNVLTQFETEDLYAWVPVGIVVLIFVFVLVCYMRNSSDPPTPRMVRLMERYNQIKEWKLQEIQRQVDLAERGIRPPETMPYIDGKRVVNRYKHDWWWSNGRDKPELQLEDYSYYPFTLLEEKCGKYQVPFDYKFPEQNFVGMKKKKRWRFWG